MKKTVLILGAVLALGLALTGCDSSGGADGPKAITITGIDAKYNGWEAEVFLFDVSSDDGNCVAVKEDVTISGDKVTFWLKATDDRGYPTDTDWTGSGGYGIMLIFMSPREEDEDSDFAEYMYTNGAALPSNYQDLTKCPAYNIASKESTIPLSKFKIIPDDDD